MYSSRNPFNSSLSRSYSLALLCLGLTLFLPLDAVPRPQAERKREVSVESLIYDLKNPDPVRRKDAAVLLGKNKAQKAIPNLIAAVNDADPSVRREIILALDNMRHGSSIPGFLSRMNDPEKDIREKCIHGVVNLYLPQEGGLVVTLTKVANFFNPWSDEWADVVAEPGIPVDPSAVSALRERLQDSEEGIRVKAARALGILRGKDAIPAMFESLRLDRSNAVRFEIVRSLRKIGDVSVAKELMNYFGYNDAKIRNEAVRAVGRLRYSAAVPELMRLFERESKLPKKELDKNLREGLLEALALIADPSSKELFIKEKQNPEDGLRFRAVEGLARIGDPSMATEISRDRLHEKDPKIQTAQAFALYRMGRKEFLDDVVNSLGNRRTHNEARQYLVELRPEELPDLLAQTRAQDVDVRESLAEVLGLIGDSRAIPALQELSKDRRGQVSALANQAQRRILARGGGH